MKSISMKLPEHMAEELEALAYRRNVSKSELVREALAAYLVEPVEEEPVAPPGSFLEAAREVVGCVEGPADLSTNEDHLADYGADHGP